MLDESASARVRAATAELAVLAQARSRRQFAEIEEALRDTSEDGLAESARNVAQQHAHQIAGTAGMFGQREATEVARQLDRLLGAAPISNAQVREARELTARLREVLWTAGSSQTDTGQPGTGAGGDEAGQHEAGQPSRPEQETTASRAGYPRDGVGIAVQTARLADELTRQARGRGLVSVAISALPGAPEADNVAAAVVQLAHGRVEQGAEVVLTLTERGVPVVALLPEEADTSTRLAAIRAGAHLLLDPPFETVNSVAQVVDALATLATARSTRDHILAVDDDEIVVQHVRDLLVTTLGARVTTLDGPDQFWSELNRTEPDLVLLDVEMPGISGLELCRAIRSDPHWRHLPVVVLSGRVDAVSLEEVYDAGADDFVVKPVVGPELCSRINNRLERNRLHRLLAETDPLTGLANRRRMESDYRRLQQLADRYGTNLSITVVDLDRFKRVNDVYGHAAGDQVLRRFAQYLTEMFRGEDIVARLGGEEFIVGMLGINKGDARERVAGVLRQFGERDLVVDGERLRVGASAGVAQYGLDGDDFGTLYRAADDALRLAKESGRGRVLIADQQQQQQEEPTSEENDVVIVESDPVRAELLRYSLTAAGYRCTVMAEPDVDTGASGPDADAVLMLCDLETDDREESRIWQRLDRMTQNEADRVLVLTADAEVAEVAVERGAAAELASGLRVEVLLRRLQEMARRPPRSDGSCRC